jgi:membrane associated rhomboid family serine protease
MMIPLGTDRPNRQTPFVVPIVIMSCFIAFGLQFFLNHGRDERLGDAEAPLLVWRNGQWTWQLLTHAFLHGGTLHLVGNMLFLWVFGTAIEDRFGRWWFLLFYLAAAAAAGLAHIATSNAPALGASGAIAACTGAFLVLFPKTLVRVVVFFIMGGVYRIPAVWVIGTAIAWDLTMTITGGGGNVAYTAHLGGYLFGAGVAFFLLATKLLASEQYDLFTAIRQWKRRSEMRAAVDGAARERARKPVDDARTQREMRLRAAVAQALAASDKSGACAAYRALVAECNDDQGPGVLPRDHQYAVACALYEQSDPAAVGACARFLKAYPRDREAGHLWLMLGMLQRGKGEFATARESLLKAEKLLHDEAILELVKAEIAQLPVGG